MARGHKGIFLKFVEDQILYPSCPAIEYKKLFFTTYEEEYQQGVEKRTVDLWNRFISLYLSMPPQRILSRFAMLNLPIGPVPTRTLAHWTDQIIPYSQSAKIEKVTRRFIDYFDEMHEREQLLKSR